MFSIYKQAGHTGYGLKEFICDTEADIQDLSLDEKMGSTAYVISTGATYMINSQGEWKKTKSAGGSSSSGGVDQSAEIEELQNQINKMQEQIKTQDDKLLAAEENNANLKLTISDQQATINKLQTETTDQKETISSLQKQCDGHVTIIETLQQEIFELKYNNIVSDTWSVLDGTVEDGVMVLNNLDNATVKDGVLIVGG